MLKFSVGEQAVENMIICLLSVYGKRCNYVNPKIFDENFILSEIRDGNTNVFSGATQDGTAAVTASVKRNLHYMKSLEICALAVNKKLRGSNYGSAIVEHILDEYKKTSNPLFYAHVVMFNTLAGRIFESNGFVPTGFLFGVCDARKHLAQFNCVSRKHSWTVFVRNNGKAKIDTVYAPERMTGFLSKTYESLNVSPVIENRPRQPDGLSVVEHEQDNYHKTLYFYVIKCGSDLQKEISAVERNYTDELQTSVALLNINDCGAVTGYETLKKMGYAFSGLKPFCGDYEFIIMSKTGDIVLDCTELKMTPLVESVYREAGEIE